MKRIIVLCIVLAAFGLLTGPASAGALDATGLLSATADGAKWDYTIDLTDTGTGPIGTFWFSWVPGQGYLPTKPTDITAPAGWTEKITDGPPPTDGYSIQFVASSPTFALTPGSSLLFGFESTDSPSTLAGVSDIHDGIPIETSTIYGGAPFSDAGFRFTVASVPEPSTLTLGIFGLATLAAALRLRRNAQNDKKSRAKSIEGTRAMRGRLASPTMRAATLFSNPSLNGVSPFGRSRPVAVRPRRSSS